MQPLNPPTHTHTDRHTPFQVGLYWTDPVIVHHTLLWLWCCELLHILNLHHLFLQNTHIHIRNQQLDRFNKQSGEGVESVCVCVMFVYVSELERSFWILLLRYRMLPCERPVMSWETGPGPESQSQHDCERLERNQKSTVTPEWLSSVTIHNYIFEIIYEITSYPSKIC